MGWGSSTRRGGGQKVRALPQKVCFPWVSKEGIWDVPGILPGRPGPLGVFKKFVQKKLVRIFRSLNLRQSVPECNINIAQVLPSVCRVFGLFFCGTSTAFLFFFRKVAFQLVTPNFFEDLSCLCCFVRKLDHIKFTENPRRFPIPNTQASQQDKFKLGFL